MKTFWALGQVFYNAAYAMVGTQATAADSSGCSCTKIYRLFLFEGLVVAVALCLETELDVTNVEQAQKEAKRFVTISLVVGVVIGGIQSLTPHWTLLMFAHLSPEVFLYRSTITPNYGCDFRI